MFNLQSGPFFVEEAVELKQGWRKGKSNFELWMPLEDTATITHPPAIHAKTKTKTKCFKGKGKSNFELWMPLENTAPITHPPAIHAKTKKRQNAYKKGKSNLEFWMLLENTATIPHPPVIPIPHVTIARLKFSNTTLRRQSKC